MQSEDLIREAEHRGAERERSSVVRRLHFEARGRSAPMRDVLLSIAADIEAQEPVPKGVE
jgi:hypothetical protein